MLRKLSAAFVVAFRNEFEFWLRFSLCCETLHLRFAFLRFESAAKLRGAQSGPRGRCDLCVCLVSS